MGGDSGRTVRLHHVPVPTAAAGAMTEEERAGVEGLQEEEGSQSTGGRHL